MPSEDKVQRVFYSTEFNDPNGNQEAKGAAVFYGADGSFWVHQTDDKSDTDWIAFIEGV